MPPSPPQSRPSPPQSRPSPPLLAALAVLAAAPLACGREQARREEAALVTNTIDALIMADRRAKRPLLDQLRATPCTLPDVCEARQACAEAFAPVAEAARLQLEARALLDQQDPALTAQVDARLTEAERQNTLAAKLQDRCISATTHLRQHYGL
jgi:hypothetical protein